MKSKYVFLGLRLIAAIIMLQTLFFKFSAAEESVYIFTTLGMEPVGRIGIGCLELLASILLFVPRFIWAGAALACGLMGGAIFFHLSKLGVEVMNDGGKLFWMGVAVFVCCVLVLWNERKNTPILRTLFQGS